MGVSYSQRFKQFGQDPTGYLVNSDGKPQAPLPPLLGTTDLSFIGNLHPIAYDPNAALNSGRYTFVPNPNPGSWEGDNYDVWEDVTRPFVKLDLKGNLGGIPFDGNIGAVADFASQRSNGFSGNGGTPCIPCREARPTRTSCRRLNLIFHLTPKDLIRFFAGREEQRPEMYQMRAGRDYSYNATDALSHDHQPLGRHERQPRSPPVDRQLGRPRPGALLRPWRRICLAGGSSRRSS